MGMASADQRSTTTIVVLRGRYHVNPVHRFPEAEYPVGTRLVSAKGREAMSEECHETATG